MADKARLSNTGAPLRCGQGRPRPRRIAFECSSECRIHGGLDTGPPAQNEMRRHRAPVDVDQRARHLCDARTCCGGGGTRVESLRQAGPLPLATHHLARLGHTQAHRVSTAGSGRHAQPQLSTGGYTGSVTNVFVQSVAKNFDEALRLLEAALIDCPDELWETDLWPDEAPTAPAPPGGLEGSAPWLLAYHALTVLDYDLSAEFEPWAPPPPFDAN